MFVFEVSEEVEGDDVLLIVQEKHEESRKACFSYSCKKYIFIFLTVLSVLLPPPFL